MMNPKQKQGQNIFPEHDQRRQRQDLPDVIHQILGVDQHSNRDEEEHRESLAEWQQVGAHLMAERRFADDDSGDESPQRQRNAEKGRRPPGRP
jgi:hypothetical protein